MRPVLIRLLLDHPWTLWVTHEDGVPAVGAAVVWSILGICGLLWFLFRKQRSWSGEQTANLVIWGIVLIGLSVQGPRLSVTSVPVFGYGFMVLCGFLSAIWLGQRQARLEGLDPALVFDAGFMILVFGILGGRLFYIIQHHDRVFRQAESLKERLIAAVNLSNGGLVLIGAMLGGAAGFYWFTRKRRFDVLRFLDAITPAIFLAIMFGRIGCLLYGCCFGDPSTLPWAITFPQGSPPFQTFVHRGFLAPEATVCGPLHPTQIYSSLNALLLCLLTLSYRRYRTHPGSLFALGLILYPLTRFLIEYLRSDELGQFGTRLTISQCLSLILFLAGCGFAFWLHRTHPRWASPSGEQSGD